jgi:hypothetical protein
VGSTLLPLGAGVPAVVLALLRFTHDASSW